jgi:hypothetical protein
MKQALLAVALLLTLSIRTSAQVNAVPSLMNFQGRLAKPDGTPVPNGTYSLKFSLFDAAAGGTQKWTQTVNPVNVRNGAFAVLLSGFPAGTFNTNLWLEIKIGSDPALTPRQQLVSVAYAMKASSVPDSSIGTAQLANGAVTSGKLAVNIFNSLGWSLTGNSGTTASQFLGTTDAKPLVLKANNRRVLRFEDKADSANTFHAVNVLGGSGINTIAAGVLGATIAGGGQDNNSGTDSPNDIRGNFGSIGGGSGNFIDAFPYATIAGGAGNIVQGDYSFIGGGSGNNTQGNHTVIAGGDSNYVFGLAAIIGGGDSNSISNGNYATIGGGNFNSIIAAVGTVGGGQANIASAIYATVAGGSQNTSSGQYATIGGGAQNQASGFVATIAGGDQNKATGDNATIGGGSKNVASGQVAVVGGGDQNYAGNTWATVAGGLQNWATGINASVGGGYLNQATNTYAMIPGGYYNFAGGIASLAAGYRGVSGYNGSFVWSDYSAEQDFSATAANQFCIRAAGGIVIEAFGSPAVYTGVGTTDAGRYVQLLNSPRAPSASGLKAGGILCADSYAYASPGKNNLAVKGTVGIGYPDPYPYTLGVNGTGFFSGNVYALDYGQSSDARFKRNIATCDNALDTILRLRGVTFDWDREGFPSRNFPEGRRIGFLAQELELALPELVSTGSDGYKSVSYAGVVPVLVEAMKAQQKQIDALKRDGEVRQARLEALLKDRDVLEARLARLEALLEQRR